MPSQPSQPDTLVENPESFLELDDYQDSDPIGLCLPNEVKPLTAPPALQRQQHPFQERVSTRRLRNPAPEPANHGIWIGLALGLMFFVLPAGLLVLGLVAFLL